MLSNFRFCSGRVSRLLGISALISLLFVAGCTTNNGGSSTPAQFGVTTTSGQLAAVVINAAYPSTTLTASNGTAPYTWSITAGALPTGLTLSPGGVLSGTPTAFGTFNFTVTVTDSATPPHTATASLSVLINPAVTSVTLNPAAVAGGTSSTGTITLSGAAVSAATVTLSSSSGAATVPATATVAAGQTTGTFPVTTSAVSASTAATITATYGVAKTAVLTVNAPTVSSLVLAPTTVTGGTTTTGTVTLSGPAATGGDAVTISSTNAAATPAATVTVAAGAATAQFNIPTATVVTTTNGNIQASFNSSSQTAALTVVPAPAIASFTAASATITSGSSTTLTAVFSNATTSSVNNGVGAVTSGTAVTVSPTATTTYTLTVTNAAGTAVTHQATVTVVPAPTITSFAAAAATITAGTSTTLTAAFSNGTGSVNNGVGAVTSGTPVTVSPSSTTTYTLTVTNTAGANVTQQATITVVPAPTITSFVSGSATITAGTSTTLTAVFSNGTGTINNGVGAVTSGTPVTISPTVTTTYTLTVTDAATTPATVTSTATVTVHVPPQITSANSAGFAVGSNGTFTVTTTGNPAAALTKTGALPANVTFVDNGNGTATVSGIPTTGTAGSYPITITANNGVAPNAVQSFTLTVTLTQAPAITSANSATFTVGASGTFTVTTTGGPAPALTKTGSLPSSVNFTDNGNGTAAISGTPAAGTAGSYPITITANNGVNPNAQQTFTLNVVATPAITSFTAAAPTISAGGSTTLTAVFSGGTGSVNNGVGVVTSGTAVTVSPSSTTTYTLTVTNTATPPATVTATATVTVAPLPLITSFTAGSTTIVSGNSTTLTPVFSNGTGSINGVGAVTSGNTVTVSPTNTTTYTLTVTNTAGSTTTSSVTITVSSAPIITSINSTSFLLGSDGSFTVTTTGSPAPAMSETGALPSGVTFVDNGNGTVTISGTPAVGTAGSYPITITANNGVTPNSTQSFTLTVTTGLPSVDIVVPGPPPLQAGGGKGIFTITVSNDQTGDTPSVTSFTLNGVACTEATCGSFSAVQGAAGSGSYSMLYTPPDSLAATISPTVTVTPSLSGQFFAGTTAFTVYPAGLVVTGGGGKLVQTGSSAQTFTYTVYNDTVVSGVGDGVKITLTASGYTCSALSSNSCGTLGTPVVSTSGTTTTTTVTYTPPSAVPAEPYDRPLILASSVAESAQYVTTEILISSTAQATPLSIPFNEKLDSALTGGAAITISANGNDPGNTRTVTWTLVANSVACAPPTCGTLGTPTVTTNGTNVLSEVTYTPPTSVPTGSGQSTPTIVATFTDNPSGTDSFNFNIVNGACGTGSEAVLNGNYAFLLRGGGANVGYYTAVGSFVANGSGTITSGFLDTNRTTTGPVTGLTITGGTYSVGSDDRGCLTLTNSNGGTATYRIALGTLSGPTATQGSMIAFVDDTGEQIRAQGVLMQQTTSAFNPSSIDGTYVFEREGVDAVGGRFAIAGLSTANGVSTLSNITDDYDDAFTGAVNQSTAGSGAFTLAASAPGGRGTSQTTITGTGGSITSNFVTYVVSPSLLLSMSTDPADDNHPITSGEAMLQTGPFTTTSLDDNGYVIYVSGLDNGNGGDNVGLGQATVTTGGAATLTLDQNDNGTESGEQVGSQTFSVGTTGRTTLSGGGGKNPIFYLVDSTQGFAVGTDSNGFSGYIQRQTGGPFSNTTVPATAFFGGGAANVGSSFDVGAVAFNSTALTISGTDDSSAPSGANCGQNCNGNGLQANSPLGNGGGSTSVSYTFEAVSNSSFAFTPSATGQGIFGGGNILVYAVTPTKFVFMQIGATTGFGGFTPANPILPNGSELFIGRH